MLDPGGGLECSLGALVSRPLRVAAHGGKWGGAWRLDDNFGAGSINRASLFVLGFPGFRGCGNLLGVIVPADCCNLSLTLLPAFPGSNVANSLPNLTGRRPGVFVRRRRQQLLLVRY